LNRENAILSAFQMTEIENRQINSWQDLSSGGGQNTSAVSQVRAT
jgi:hypothetical protein